MRPRAEIRREVQRSTAEFVSTIRAAASAVRNGSNRGLETVETLTVTILTIVMGNDRIFTPPTLYSLSVFSGPLGGIGVILGIGGLPSLLDGRSEAGSGSCNLALVLGALCSSSSSPGLSDAGSGRS